MKKLILLTTILSLGACASNHAVDMTTDTLSVEVSASAPDNRADAVLDGAKSIPQQVLDRGYDSYTILDIHSDTVSGTYGGGYNTLDFDIVTRSLNAVGGMAIATLHSGEASLKVKMFHYGEKGAEKALDARKQLDKYKN